jgi:hypothetical protein
MDGWLHAFSMRSLMDRGPGPVVDTVPDYRPAVIPAREHEVELISPLWPVLGEPDVSRLGVDGEALGVPVPVAPDLRARAGPIDERIVGGNAAVVMKSNSGPVVVGKILGRVCLEISPGRRLAVSDREEQEPVPVEREPTPVMPATL